MNNNVKTFFHSHRLKWYDLILLSTQSSIIFIDLLKDYKYKIDGFDGFKIFDDWKYQIDQNYSRDYSNFTLEESYLLIKEYFLKSENSNIYYNISYRKIN